MKSKNIEDILYKALEEYKSKQENWTLEIDDLLKNALDYYRLKLHNEQMERNSENNIKLLNKKIIERDEAINNLRGYISFLESRIVELQMDLGNYSDF